MPPQEGEAATATTCSTVQVDQPCSSLPTSKSQLNTTQHDQANSSLSDVRDEREVSTRTPSPQSRKQVCCEMKLYMAIVFIFMSFQNGCAARPAKRPHLLTRRQRKASSGEDASGNVSSTSSARASRRPRRAPSTAEHDGTERSPVLMLCETHIEPCQRCGSPVSDVTLPDVLSVPTPPPQSTKKVRFHFKIMLKQFIYFYYVITEGVYGKTIKETTSMPW